jgi:hypothetical protein
VASQRGEGPGGAIYNWERDVTANGYGLTELGSLTMADNPAVITDLVGANLSVENGVLGTDLWNADVDTAENSLLNLDLVDTATLSVSDLGASVYSADGGEYVGGGSTITFDTARFDHRDEFDLDDHQFTASRDGYYQVSVGVAVESPGDGESVRVTLRVNDTAEARIAVHASSDDVMDIPSSKLLALSEGDQLRAVLSRAGTGGSNAYLGGMANTWLTIHQVG